MKQLKYTLWWNVPAIREQPQLVSARDRAKVALVLVVALLQGLLYLLLLPPWQHYDEPTHFEYAWLIANHGHIPADGEMDDKIRRDIAASMIAHNFYWNLTPPDLNADPRTISIGTPELGHPPAYYQLVSLPLRFVRHLDVTSQLYVARLMSLVLFLLTIAVVAGVMRDLAPPGHLLRWTVPLLIVLMAPVVDLMTAVNNDVGAIFVFSLFLWGAVRTIRFGITWQRVVWVVGTALLAILTKNTSSLALPLTPLIFLIALRTQRWWRWLVLGSVGSVILLLLAFFDWGDAAYWYRSEQTALLMGQDQPTRTKVVGAPVGATAILLETTPAYPNRYLRNPLLAQDLQRVVGQTITFGGWVWADQPATITGPGLLLAPRGATNFNRFSQSLHVTTTPTLAVWTFPVPAQTGTLEYILFGRSVERRTQPLQIMLSGAFLIPGVFPAGAAPVFDDASARTGTWSGQRFTNLLRNPTAAVAWPRVRPWLAHALIRYVHRSPAQALTALFDVQRTGVFLTRTVTPTVFYGFFNGFAWSHVRLAGSLWPAFFVGLTCVGVVGCVRWLIWLRARTAAGVRPALAFIALAGVLILVNTILRPLPMLEPKVLLPAARYAFPAVLPVALGLVGGWWAILPWRYRRYGVYVLLVCLIGLNVVSTWTIWSFYRALPVT